MSKLKEKLKSKIPQWRDEISSIVKNFGERKISEVSVKQAYGGMRGVKGLVCDTSEVKPDKGLIIRGYPIAELTDKKPEDILFLLLTGELPDQSEREDLEKELNERAGVPSYVWDVLRSMPEDSHPMTMLNTGILVMERESIFKKRYNEGMGKDKFWEPALEDCLNIIAKMPELAAGVYRIRYKKGDLIPHNKNLDWSSNYANMLGIEDPDGKFKDLIRLYLVLHSDHEGGNVSAFTTFIVGSALSNIYYALSAGLNGLAGPLHGLANQECLKFVLSIKEKFGGVPDEEQLRQFAWDTLNSGRVIPGYGHAVLRVTDPRFTAFHKFGKENLPDDEVFQIVDKLFNVIPSVLKEHGKAKNPWPNVDAGSGALLYHFGLTEFEYYTVLFSVSRALGVCSQNVIARAMGYAIVRPKSVTTSWIKKELGI